jgi:hypothetical protein
MDQENQMFSRRIPPRILGVLLTVPLLLVVTGSAEAQRNGKGPKKETVRSAGVAVHVSFSDLERDRITHFFAENRVRNPKPLPPGIRKKIARGKPMPPGIAKQVLPEDLVFLLPVREGYHRVQVGLDVLLVEVATGIIHDVLMDVIR